MVIEAHPDADLSPKQVQELSDQLADKRREIVDSIDLLRETIMSKHGCDILDAGDSASHNEEHRRAEHRQSYVNEPTEPTGAVHGGGLIQLLGNALQSGQEYDHVEARLTPSAHYEKGRHRPFGAR